VERSGKEWREVKRGGEEWREVGWHYERISSFDDG
jgi:hypothetical protein